jgi:hypothetical protein
MIDKERCEYERRKQRYYDEQEKAMRVLRKCFEKRPVQPDAKRHNKKVEDRPHMPE